MLIRLTLSSQVSSCLSLPSAMVTGVSHHTHLRVYFLIYNFNLVKKGGATKINSVSSIYVLNYSLLRLFLILFSSKFSDHPPPPSHTCLELQRPSPRSSQLIVRCIFLRTYRNGICCLGNRGFKNMILEQEGKV